MSNADPMKHSDERVIDPMAPPYHHDDDATVDMNYERSLIKGTESFVANTDPCKYCAFDAVI